MSALPREKRCKVRHPTEPGTYCTLRLGHVKPRHAGPSPSGQRREWRDETPDQVAEVIAAKDAEIAALKATLHNADATPASEWATELAAARENVAGTAALLVEAEGRITELTGAATAAAWWLYDPDDAEQWERIAAEFMRATGMLRPGKDDARGVHSQDERAHAFRRWCEERNRKLLAQLRAALKPTSPVSPREKLADTVDGMLGDLGVFVDRSKLPAAPSVPCEAPEEPKREPGPRERMSDVELERWDRESKVSPLHSGPNHWRPVFEEAQRARAEVRDLVEALSDLASFFPDEPRPCIHIKGGQYGVDDALRRARELSAAPTPKTEGAQ